MDFKQIQEGIERESDGGLDENREHTLLCSAAEYKDYSSSNSNLPLLMHSEGTSNVLLHGFSDGRNYSFVTSKPLVQYKRIHENCTRKNRAEDERHHTNAVTTMLSLYYSLLECNSVRWPKMFYKIDTVNTVPEQIEHPLN